MSVPSWVQDAVFYQIFPDRFANGDPRNDPSNVQPWGAPPTTWGFQGGDLRGIMQRFDYLLELGINALYLNPIFEATSNHRYNTRDYYRIDRRLGSMEEFRALLDLAHGNGVRVILDGVFNHCGRGFFAFNDLLENEEHSDYRDWYHVHRFPLEAYGPGPAQNYAAWWDLKSLPKFNIACRAVRRYLLDVAHHWIEQGVDGWRLDVPGEIDDMEFWAEFRAVVKSANPEAYLVGEIWQVAPAWVGDRVFDGLMHYPLREAILDFIVNGEQMASACAERLEGLLAAYPREHTLAQMISLGTHDTERIYTLCKGDLDRLRLAFFFLLTFPGAPSIYYGDEIGMQGGKDPDNRRAFPWDESEWQSELRRHVRRLIALRRDHQPLRRGLLRSLLVQDPGLLAYAREDESGARVVLVNAGEAAVHTRIPVDSLGWGEGAIAEELLSGVRAPIAAGHLETTAAPRAGAIWTLR